MSPGPTPPREGTTPPAPVRSGDLLSRWRPVLDRFELAHLHGERPDIDAYLDGDGPARHRLLIELVHIELECRLKAGEPARVEDYLRRYPELAGDRAAALELIAAERRLRGRAEALAADEYVRRFPDYAAELPALLAQAGGPTAGPEATAPGGGVPGDDPFAGPLPRTFGRYRVLRRLGAGGMGAVYLAHDTTLERDVALKVSRVATEDPDAARFLREARAAAGLQHEGICRVLDFGVLDSVAYLTMEHVRGRPLAALTAGGAAVPPRRAAELVRQVALAMEAAHGAGVVHRDLKPANILLDEHDRPRVVDFGLARRAHDPALTRAGTPLGTPAYMSPEQVRGAPTDPRTDVYSLGVVLYELLTGRLPFPTRDVCRLLYQIVHEEPPAPSAHRPGLDPALEAVCRRAMARDPAARYASMAGLAEALRVCLAPAGTTAPAAAAPGGPRAARRRRLAAVAVLLLLGVPAAWYAAAARRTPPAGGAAAPRGWIDITVTDPTDAGRRGLRLRDEGALPLRPGDRVRVEAGLDRPAYLYVVWIDPEGRSFPVYPWKPGHWEERPAAERPAARLSLPADPALAWPLPGGPSGMDTLVLLARPESLPADFDLPSRLQGLPEQRRQNPHAAVWFRDGEVVHDDPERAAPNFDEELPGDPVVQTQRLLRQRLGRDFSFSRAVSFAYQGK
jgi:hypothetical protein